MWRCMTLEVWVASMQRWQNAASQFSHHRVAVASSHSSHGAAGGAGSTHILERVGIRSRRLKFGFGSCAVTTWQLGQRHEEVPVLLSVVLIRWMHA